MTVPAEVMVERGHLPAQSEQEIRLSAKRNPETITRLLAEAGFADPELEELEVAYRFADAEELWFFVSELRGPVALALAGLPETSEPRSGPRSRRRASSAAGGYELGGVSLNVATR